MPVNRKIQWSDVGPAISRPRRRQLQRRAPLFCCAVLAATAAVKPAMGGYTFSTIANFDTVNGYYPGSALVLDSSGNLFGSTALGGSGNQGSLYEISAGSNVINSLASFTGSNGGFPQGNLTVDTLGNIYGVTQFGGDNNLGTIYQLSAATHTLSTVASFSSTFRPYTYEAPVADAAGNLYGTASLDGHPESFQIYQVSAGSHSITTAINAGFSGPSGRLTSAGAGQFYVPAGYGQLYKISPADGSYSYVGSGVYGAVSGVVADRAGNVYGVSTGTGTIVEIKAGTSQAVAIANLNTNSFLTIDPAGNLFGTTAAGGTGSVFELPAGTSTLTTLATFPNSGGNVSGLPSIPPALFTAHPAMAVSTALALSSNSVPLSAVRRFPPSPPAPTGTPPATGPHPASPQRPSMHSLQRPATTRLASLHPRQPKICTSPREPSDLTWRVSCSRCQAGFRSLMLLAKTPTSPSLAVR